MSQEIDNCCLMGDTHSARKIGFAKAFDLLVFVAEIMALQKSHYIKFLQKCQKSWSL